MSMEEFKRLEKLWHLEEVAEEECPMCSKTMTYYTSKYADGANIRFCYTCHELERDINITSVEENVCPYCDEIVRFEDEDKDDFITCSDNGCDHKAHLSCTEICSKCKVWACDHHIGEFIECDSCGLLHDDDCFVSLGGGFIDAMGHLCEDCFYRDDDLIDEIKRPFRSEKLKHVIEEVDKSRSFYVMEARENFDLTIMLTHLVKGDAAYGQLIKILNDKCVKASETGYFHYKYGTKAVCFADLTSRGLLRHSKKYSPFGIAFQKEYVFEKGGGPALYVREDILGHSDHFPESVRPFVNKINLKTHDFHHEREWRTPEDLLFEHNEVSIVYAPVKYHGDLREQFPEIKVLLDLDLLQMI